MNPNSKTVYITFSDVIDIERVKELIQLCTNVIQNIHPKELYFMFSSSGGSVDAGINLYNFLKSLPVKITMHNMGSIDSIANVVFCAGDDRFASPGSTFLFHGVVMTISGNLNLTLNQIIEMKDRIEKNHEQISEIICTNSTLKSDTIKKMFLQGETHSTDFALQHNIIKEVKSLKLPENAVLISLNHK